MNKTKKNINSKLTGINAEAAHIYQPWEQDNQAWWDWYITLADNPYVSQINGKLSASFKSAKLLTISDLKKELNTSYPLSEKQKKFFKKNGFVKLKNMLSKNAVYTLRKQTTKEIVKNFSSEKLKKLDFVSLDLIWKKNLIIKEFVLSKKIAKVAAQLLNVPSVRLYHDNILSKKPRCGRTPWHYDTHHFPIDSDEVITVWIPAQEIPINMGPLSFAMPIDVYKKVQQIEFNKFNKNYDSDISRVFKDNNVKIESGPFELGEVSFHHNLCFHTASSNETSKNRVVLANTYFKDGSKLVKNPTMVSGDWQKFIPNTKPGELIKTPLNPICWSGFRR